MIGLEQIDTLKYGADGLLPVVAQDETTGAVLMLAYANREALRQTLSTGRAFYYSRSRRELWQKGETSGHFQYITDVRTDCDGDAVLYTVRQQGVACHTGAYSCFGAADTRNGAAPADTLRALQTTVQDRRDRPKEGSYTNYLFDKGLDKILKKVGEETAEVIIAAKNQSADELRYETADLCYHLTVLLTQAGLSWEDITGELRRREEK